MALAKINGRMQFFDTDRLEIKEEAAGRFTISYDKGDFQVSGGRAAGGSARDWFVRNELFYGDRWLPANSMVEAIKMGVQY